MRVETSGRSLYLRLRTRKSAKPTGRIIRASAHICKLLVIVTDPPRSLLPSPPGPSSLDEAGRQGKTAGGSPRGRVPKPASRDAKRAREFLYSLHVYIFITYARVTHTRTHTHTHMRYTFVRSRASAIRSIFLDLRARNATIMLHARSPVLARRGTLCNVAAVAAFITRRVCVSRFY